MTKIQLKNHGSSDMRTYTTPQGNTYEFYKGMSTKVKNPADALHFLKAGNGKLFNAEGAGAKLFKSLESAAKKILKVDKLVDEDNPPDETGALDPTDDELCDDVPLDYEVDSEEATDSVVEETDPVVDEVDSEQPTEETEEEIADYDSMSKEELDVHAEKNLGIKLDRRKSKKDMIADLKKELESKK